MSVNVQYLIVLLCTYYNSRVHVVLVRINICNFMRAYQVIIDLVFWNNAIVEYLNSTFSYPEGQERHLANPENACIESEFHSYNICQSSSTRSTRFDVRILPHTVPCKTIGFSTCSSFFDGTPFTIQWTMSTDVWSGITNDYYPAIYYYRRDNNNYLNK